jgi:hypothetical protein
LVKKLHASYGTRKFITTLGEAESCYEIPSETKKMETIKRQEELPEVDNIFGSHGTKYEGDCFKGRCLVESGRN